MVLIAFAITSCNGSSGNRDRVVTMRDSSGITIVENDGAAADVPTWSTAEALSIGRVDGGTEYTFGQISDVDVDDDGRFYVLDRLAQQASVFGPEGRLVRRFAAPGEGPGELSGEATDIFVTPDDSAYILDLWQLRFNVYSPAGTPVRTIRMEHGRQGPFEFRHMDDGRLLIRWFTYNSDDEGRFVPWDALLLSDSAQDAFDTLLVFEYRPPDFGNRGEIRLPLIPNVAFFDVSGDERIAWSANGHHQVAIHTMDGQLERIIRNTSWERRAITDGERNALETRYRIANDRSDGPLPDNLNFPDSLPTITALRASPDGGYWIQRMGPVSAIESEALTIPMFSTWLGGKTWEVYDHAGTLTATIDLPPRFRVTRVLASAVIGIQRDELDIERVVRLDILR